MYRDPPSRTAIWIISYEENTPMWAMETEALRFRWEKKKQGGGAVGVDAEGAAE